jgi:hypothetical protein
VQKDDDKAEMKGMSARNHSAFGRVVPPDRQPGSDSESGVFTAHLLMKPYRSRSTAQNQNQIEEVERRSSPKKKKKLDRGSP